ncbi:MAG: hypothetical protein WCW66_01720 [Patescibacteria group bacterium]|jgi:hypothetical protein
MSNKNLFVILLWIVKGVTVVLTFLLFYTIFIHFFTASGKFEVAYSFGEDSEYISHLEPWQRLLPPEENGGVWSQKIKDDSVYFNANGPLWYEDVTVEIVYKNENQIDLNIGANINDADGYRDQSLQNKLIDNLEWKKIQHGNVILYQKEDVYQSIADFKKDFDNNSLESEVVGQFDYDLGKNSVKLGTSSSLDSLKYIITDYSSPVGENGWLVKKITFNAGELYQNERGVIRFRISAPGLRKSEGSIEVREIRITYSNPMITISDLPRTAEYFIDKIIEKVKNDY